MYRIAIRIIVVAAVGLLGSCLIGCSAKITNDGITVKSLPAGAWSIGFSSPEFTFDSEFDAEKTATEIVKGAKIVADEIMGLPIFSLIGDLFEGPPEPTPDSG